MALTSLTWPPCGHRTLSIARKGGARRDVVLNPATAQTLDDYIGEREHGPVFTTKTGRRLDQSGAFRPIRRLARAAGIEHAEKLSLHSLRHTFVTLAREAGVPLEDVQNAAGHANPRTTRRYDRGPPQPLPPPCLHPWRVPRRLRTGGGDRSGTLSQPERDAIELPPDELEKYDYFPGAELPNLLIPRLARRVRAAIDARREAQMAYLEHGETTHAVDQDWWTTEDVAKHLNVAASTIRAYAARGQMPSPGKHVGRTAPWRPEAISSWNAERTRKRL